MTVVVAVPSSGNPMYSSLQSIRSFHELATAVLMTVASRGMRTENKPSPRCFTSFLFFTRVTCVFFFPIESARLQADFRFPVALT
jgi:hypothetical protein